MQILAPYRARIDALDDRIIDLLAERTGIIREVAAVKKEHNIPSVLPDRVEEVIGRCAARAAAKGMEADLARVLYAEIVRRACALEDAIMEKEAGES
ncbi:MAG: chorismate mutase [Micavibrio sp.]